LGGIIEVDDEVSASGPFDGPEVRCFGLSAPNKTLRQSFVLRLYLNYP
jgi:hypothetical protein